MIAFLKDHPASGTADLAANLGLPASGGTFLLAKLRREGKL